jgi:hypothetical protein
VADRDQKQVEITDDPAVKPKTRLSHQSLRKLHLPQDASNLATSREIRNNNGAAHDHVPEGWLLSSPSVYRSVKRAQRSMG